MLSTPERAFDRLLIIVQEIESQKLAGRKKALGQPMSILGIYLTGNQKCPAEDHIV